jgi:hypothetical protein
MKYTVITNDGGDVVATYLQPEEKSLRAGEPRLRLHAGSGQRLHEVEAPNQFAEIENVDVLHAKLKDHIRGLRAAGAASRD